MTKQHLKNLYDVRLSKDFTDKTSEACNMKQ